MAIQMGRLILKAIELAITIGIIVIVETKSIYMPHQLLTCGTIVGFTLICAVLVLGHLASSPVEKRIDMLLSIAGVILFTATGSIIIEKYKDSATPFGLGKEAKDYALATGSLAIINAVVFLIDVVTTFRS